MHQHYQPQICLHSTWTTLFLMLVHEAKPWWYIYIYIYIERRKKCMLEQNKYEKIRKKKLFVDQFILKYIYIYIYIYIRHGWWHNAFSHRKWTWQPNFNSWVRLFVFHIILIPLWKVWIQLFFCQLWINKKADKAI